MRYQGDILLVDVDPDYEKFDRFYKKKYSKDKAICCTYIMRL